MRTHVTFAFLLAAMVEVACGQQHTITQTQPLYQGIHQVGQGTTTSNVLYTVDNGSMGNSAWACDSSGSCMSLTTAPVALRKHNPHPATIQSVKASAALLDHAVLAPASYSTLSTSIGLNPSVTSDEARITDAIAKLGLHVYTFSLVDDYLYSKAIEHGKNIRWVWKAMRDADLKAMAGLQSYPVIDAESVDQTGVMDPMQYARRLPVSVLENVKNFLGEVPDANFFISDYVSVKPDPFLMVTTPRLFAAGKIWVIQVWDEPGFLESPVNISIGAPTASIQIPLLAPITVPLTLYIPPMQPAAQ